MDNLVSVIIPCYNGEQYIDNSIRSVYEQDYPFVELIVINDGSSDRSEEKILAWKQAFHDKGYQLKYIAQDNQGPGAATNLGLKYVTGKYLTLLDADDRYLPGAIRHKAQYLDDHPDCAGVRNNGWFVRETGRNLFITDDQEKSITDLFCALSSGSTNNWAGTYMVRTDILFDFYPDRNILPSRLGQNFQILLPVAYGRKFGYIDLPLMEYNIHPNSHSHAMSVQAQYDLSEKNAQGWRDIYFQILGKLTVDPQEYQHFAQMYNEVYYRGCFMRAAYCSRKAELHYNYLHLKKLNRLTLEDRVVYYNTINSPWVLFWKFMLKTSSVLSKAR